MSSVKHSRIWATHKEGRGTVIKLSQLVADVDPTRKVRYRVSKGETFYRVPIQIDKLMFDIVISEYLLARNPAGAYKLTGYLCSDYITEGTEKHLFTYFYCSGIEVTDEDICTGPIYITGKVAKCRKLTTLADGRQILPVVIRHRTRDGHTSILHVLLNDTEARFAASYPEMDSAHIEVVGVLQARYTTVEVSVQSMTLYGEGKEVLWATSSEA